MILFEFILGLVISLVGGFAILKFIYFVCHFITIYGV